MSCGSGSYTVVSQAELRRRALAAARERFLRVVADVKSFQRKVEASKLTFPGLDVEIPRSELRTSNDPAVIEAASEALVSELARAREALAAAEAGKLRKHFSALAAHITPLLAESPAPERKKSAESPAQRRAKVDQIIAKLPADCPAAVVEQVTSGISQVMASTSAQQLGLALGSLRLVTQQEIDRQIGFRKRAAEVEQLLARLDGLAGPAVEEARVELLSLDPDDPLPPGVGQRVDEACRSAVSVANRQFVLDTLASVLPDMGYQLSQEFVADAPADGAIAMLPGSQVHGLQVRAQAGRLFFNVVRFDEQGRRDVPADRQAEKSWCAQVKAMKARMKAKGCLVGENEAEFAHPHGAALQVIKRAAPVSAVRSHGGAAEEPALSARTLPDGGSS